jgi:hypothetical protein
MKGVNDGRRRGVPYSSGDPCRDRSRGLFADCGMGPWPIEAFQGSCNDRLSLNHPPAFIPQVAEVTAAAPQSRWARFFITQPAKSVRKRVWSLFSRSRKSSRLLTMLAPPLGMDRFVCRLTR